jgi:hypothetical protein
LAIFFSCLGGSRTGTTGLQPVRGRARLRRLGKSRCLTDLLRRAERAARQTLRRSLTRQRSDDPEYVTSKAFWASQCACLNPRAGGKIGRRRYPRECGADGVDCDNCTIRSWPLANRNRLRLYASQPNEIHTDRCCPGRHTRSGPELVSSCGWI